MALLWKRARARGVRAGELHECRGGAQGLVILEEGWPRQAALTRPRDAAGLALTTLVDLFLLAVAKLPEPLRARPSSTGWEARGCGIEA